METATAQRDYTITRHVGHSYRIINRYNKVNPHIIAIGVAGSIFNNYTIKPLVKLSLAKENAKLIIPRLACHAI